MKSEESDNWVSRVKEHPLAKILVGGSVLVSIVWGAAWWYYGIQLNTKDLELRQLQLRLQESSGQMLSEGNAPLATSERRGSQTGTGNELGNLAHTGPTANNKQDRMSEEPGSVKTPGTPLSSLIEREFAHLHGATPVPTEFPSRSALDLARVGATQVAPKTPTGKQPIVRDDSNTDAGRGFEKRLGELVRITKGAEALVLEGEVSVKVEQVTVDGNPPRATVTADVRSKEGKTLRIENKGPGFAAVLQGVKPVEVRVISVDSSSAEIFFAPQK